MRIMNEYEFDTGWTFMNKWHFILLYFLSQCNDLQFHNFSVGKNFDPYLFWRQIRWTCILWKHQQIRLIFDVKNSVRYDIIIFDWSANNGPDARHPYPFSNEKKKKYEIPLRCALFSSKEFEYIRLPVWEYLNNNIFSLAQSREKRPSFSCDRWNESRVFKFPRSFGSIQISRPSRTNNGILHGCTDNNACNVDAGLRMLRS